MLVDGLLKAGATALVIVTAVGLFVLLRRLRTSAPRSRRAFWLGGVVPVVASGVYVYFGAPSYSLPVLLGAAGVGLGLGIWLARAGGRPMAVDRGQRGGGVLAWSAVYIVAALTSVTGNSFYQAAGAAALAFAAGAAVGVQVGLIARPKLLPPAAPAAAAASLIVLLALGPSVGITRAVDGQPDPCMFMDESIWPGTLQAVPGLVRTGGDALPSCGASFAYGTDPEIDPLLGGIQVTRYRTDADAQAAVALQSPALTAVDLGDGGFQGTYVASTGTLWTAIFSVHNYVGWLGGHGNTPAHVQQGEAAAVRLSNLMKASIGPAPGPTPTPTPHPSAPPTIPPTPAPTPTQAPTPTPTLGPTPSPTLAPDQLGVSISCAQDLTAKPYTVSCTASPLNSTVGAALQYAWTWTFVDENGATTNGRGDSPGVEFTRLFARGTVTVTVSASDVVAKKDSAPVSAIVELDPMANLAEMLTLGAKAEPQTIDEVLKGVFGGAIAIGLGLGIVGPSRKPSAPTGDQPSEPAATPAS